MRTLDNKNYYEVLEIQSDAAPADIRRAFNDTMAIYREDALASYALFSDQQRADIIRTLETAFNTLIDDHKRAHYNRRLIESGQGVILSPRGRNQDYTDLLSCVMKTSRGESLFKWVQIKSREKRTQKLIDTLLSKEAISGMDLKQIRRQYGIELSEIYEQTRISRSVIRNIERDQFDALPATIYLKQFLKTYAELLQLDSTRIVNGYLNNMRKHRQTDAVPKRNSAG